MTVGDSMSGAVVQDRIPARGASGLEIARVVVTPVAFPDPPLLNSAGMHQPWALRAVVEVHTTDGLVGLGESYGDAPHLDLLRQAAGTMVGLDPFALHTLYRRIGLASHPTSSKALLRVYSPFEVACLDLQGQATGRPVCDLLGGRAREAVPFAAYLFYKWAAHPSQTDDEWGAALGPDGLVAQARRMIEKYGFRSIKLKGGAFAPEHDIAAIHALRSAFPDHQLRLDPNCAWRVDTSVRVATETAGMLEYLEDPTPTIAGMAEVARQVPVPLATNMCVVGFDDIPEAFAAGAVQVVLADHHYWGGLRKSLELASTCQTWDVGVSMHSNSHLGISLAAMVHLAAAAPEVTYSVDTHTPWQCGVDVVEHPLSIVDGEVQVPAAPGLGVTLDRDALATMHEDYLRSGIRERDDESYLRTVDPTWRKRRPRW